MFAAISPKWPLLHIIKWINPLFTSWKLIENSKCIKWYVSKTNLHHNCHIFKKIFSKNKRVQRKMSNFENILYFFSRYITSQQVMVDWYCHNFNYLIQWLDSELETSYDRLSQSKSKLGLRRCCICICLIIQRFTSKTFQFRQLYQLPPQSYSGLQNISRFSRISNYPTVQLFKQDFQQPLSIIKLWKEFKPWLDCLRHQRFARRMSTQSCPLSPDGSTNSRFKVQL